MCNVEGAEMDRSSPPRRPNNDDNNNNIESEGNHDGGVPLCLQGPGV